jgi:hypothetical protein
MGHMVKPGDVVNFWSSFNPEKKGLYFIKQT